jgi:integrase
LEHVKSEILKLKRVVHIDFEKRLHFLDTKIMRTRTIPLADTTLAMLKNYRLENLY